MSSEARELRRLQALAKAWRLLAPLERPEEVYRVVVETAKAVTRAVSVLLFLYRSQEDALSHLASTLYSTVTLLARLRGWSTSRPRRTAIS